LCKRTFGSWMTNSRTELYSRRLRQPSCTGTAPTSCACSSRWPAQRRSKSLTRPRTSGRGRNDRSHRFAPRRPLGPPSLQPIGLTSVTTVTSRVTSLQSVPSLIALANVANRLSGFMPLQTLTPRKTRSSIRPTPSRTRKKPRPRARLGVARRDVKAYGDEIVAPCLTALRDLCHDWPVNACDAELPSCTGQGRRGEHSANWCSVCILGGLRQEVDNASAHAGCRQQPYSDEVCHTFGCRHRRCTSVWPLPRFRQLVSPVHPWHRVYWKKHQGDLAAFARDRLAGTRALHGRTASANATLGLYKWQCLGPPLAR